MRVAVTGAGGRIGRVVAGWFTERGHEVLGIDRRSRHVPAGAEACTTDLTDPDAVAGTIKGADVLVHLAAISSPELASAQKVFGDNTQATFGVLTGASRAGVPRVVYASSGASYGFAYGPRPISPEYLPIDEEHRQQPADPYGLSKLIDEATAAMVHRATGLSVIGLRFPFVGNLAGLRSHAEFVRRQPQAGARQLWGYLEVNDLARAIDRAVGATQIGCEIVGLAAADTMSTTPTEELVRTYHPTAELRSPLTDCAGLWNTAKAQQLLGWRPQATWRTGEAK